MSDSQTAIEIPYYTHLTWALFALSFLLSVLSISIIGAPKNETKAELLISYIILSSCMFIGTIPFIIKTVIQCLDKTANNKPEGLLAIYTLILIFSTVNLVISGILLNKLEKEEEETKNYSGALIFLSFLFLVLYVLATIFEYKKEKEYVYQPSEDIYNKAADKLEQRRVYNILWDNIMRTPGNDKLPRKKLHQLVRTKMDRYNTIKGETISSTSQTKYSPDVLRTLVLQKLNEQQQKERLQKERLQSEKLRRKYFSQGGGDARILKAIQQQQRKNAILAN